MPARVIPNAAGARPAWGWCIWLALVAVGLQAPSISVRHCHPGGADDHHHAVWPQGMQHSASTADDLTQLHGHRVVWGWDLHDPSGQDSDGMPGEGQPPAGVIQASLAPAEEIQTRLAVCPLLLPMSLRPLTWALAVVNARSGELPAPVGSLSRPLVLRV